MLAQAEMPGLPGREVPRRPLATDTRQRPVEDLPLFSLERDARARALDAAQTSLLAPEPRR